MLVSKVEISEYRGVAGWVHEFAPFGLFTTDTQLKITEWNRWLEKQSGRTGPEVIGSSLLDLYPELVARKMDGYFKEALEGRNAILSHVFHRYLIPMALDDDGQEPVNMPQSAIVSPLLIGDEICGTIGYIEDVSERIRREQELLDQVRAREKLIQKLKAATAEIKTLSGLLPICSNCKKIRDDKGYWNQIESYITRHSEAMFSHGICPECAKKLYPEFYESIYEDDEDAKEQDGSEEEP